MNENIFNPNYGVEKPAEVASLPPIVSLKDIYQHYDTGETVFKDFNLSIPDIPEKGQFITLMGQSGCGKSTILRYISGLQSPTSGTILFKGQPRDRKNSVPMVFQQYTNLEWKTVLENVRLPLDINNVNREEANEKAMEILKVVGLETHADQYAKYPLLSGGQLQRVAIARGLIMNPEILLMDEPFGALDVKTRQDMQLFLRTIFENQEDMTIILVTHSISEAVFLSDKVYVLGNKPAEVIQDLDISLGNIRSESVIGSEKFKEYESELRSALGL
jgi:NitT/TauT family transport system ATP-binding protein